MSTFEKTYMKFHLQIPFFTEELINLQRVRITKTKLLKEMSKSKTITDEILTLLKTKLISKH